MFDAVLIPGGGVTNDGQLPIWSQLRFDQALKYQNQTKFFIPLSAGTTHKPPPLTQTGVPLTEAAIGGHYLLKHGVDKDRILLEQFSWDTIGNAYFVRTLHTDPGQLNTLLIITSEFHLPRTQKIFEWVFKLPAQAHPAYQLSFVATPDLGLSPAQLHARQQREATSLKKLEQVIANITTLQQLHHWLFSEHQAYVANRMGKSDPLDTSVQETY